MIIYMPNIHICSPLPKLSPFSDGLIIRKLTKCVTFKDIPREAAQQFDYIKVILFDMAGKGDIWVALTNEQLASIWNLLLEEKYQVSTNRCDGDTFTLFSDVKKLVSEIFKICCTG